MRRAFLICVICLFIGTALPALPSAASEPALPDLYPDLHVYVVNQTATCATAGTPVAMVIYVYNAGPGNITSANITISVDGSVIASVPAIYDFSAEGYYGNIYTWNTTGVAPGNHTIGVLVNDTAGDANPANNTLEQNFTIVKPAPGMTMTLDESVVVAVVTESAPGLAVITGNITMTGLGNGTMNILLTSSVDIGWVSRIAPSRVQADRDGRYAISVCVTVPQGTSASQIGKAQISASGVAGNDSMWTSGAAFVQVHPYYRLTLDSKEAYIEIPPGGQARFEILLTNAGNAIDSYNLAIDNLKELTKKKWIVVLSANTVTGIEPGEYKSFMVIANSPDAWTMDKSEPTLIVVRATSTGNRTVGLSFPIYAYEKGSNPAWYNMTVLGSAVVVMAVVAAAGIWAARRRRTKPAKPAAKEPASGKEKK
jgi:hypothetical protein